MEGLESSSIILTHWEAKMIHVPVLIDHPSQFKINGKKGTWSSWMSPFSISFPKHYWKLTHISLSHVRLFETPWSVAHQAPLSMGFSRQEYWSGLAFPPPGDLSDPGIKLRSPTLQADSNLWATREAHTESLS